MKMYLAGVSVRRVEDITQALWGTRVGPSTVSDLNQKIYGKIIEWRERPLVGDFPLCLRPGGHRRGAERLSRDSRGERERQGRQDKLDELPARTEAARLKGVQIFVSDKCLGLVENFAEFYPEARWQRSVVHFYRNVWTAVPTGKVKEVAGMPKAIHAQEDARAAKEKNS